MKSRLLKTTLVLPMVLYPSIALAIPSPDLVINVFASMGQLLGMLSIVFGGAAMAARKRNKTRSGSPWPFRVALALFIGTAVSFVLYASHQIDLDNSRLQRNLIRSSTEEGKTVGDVSLKTLSYSDQLEHPLALDLERYDTLLAEGTDLEIIDIREQEETEAGMIVGATWRHYPALKADSSSLEGGEKKIVFVCFSGNRSGELCALLAERGVDCHFMMGGYEKWIASGRPLDSEQKRSTLRALPYFPNQDTLLDTPDIEALEATGDLTYVDVRYPGDFEQFHVPGSINIPLRKLTAEQSRPLLEALPEGRPVVATCYDKRSCFYGQILGLRLTRLGYEFLGRYSVPHEYMQPPKVRAHVQQWDESERGNSLFSFVATPIKHVLYWVMSETGNFFFAILLTVFALRVLILPFGIKMEIDRLREEKRAPQVKLLKEKLVDHPVRLQRALRRISKEDNATPFVNLVGNLIQIPLFLVLFRVVGMAADTYGDSLLWIGPVSNVDPYYVLPTLVAVLLYLHLYSGAAHPLGKRKMGLYVGSCAFIFLLTFRLSAALNIYLLLSIVLLANQNLIIRSVYRYRERRKQRANRPYRAPDPSKAIVPLREITLEAGGGNKALKLGEMLRAGFPVPDGFSVTHKALSTLSLSAQHKREIEAQWHRIKAEKVAVRSSGLNEDGEDKSYAGVFESILEVRWGQFYEALAEVKASFSKARAEAYSGQEEAVAIVVQKMVDAEYAGVMFTEHPATSGSMMIEMVKGLGEALVSGQQTPDSFQYGRQTRQTLFKGEPPIPLEPLVSLGHQVEAHYGRPQDIEWAYTDGSFHLLQTRDITSDSRMGSSPKSFFERERFRLLKLCTGAEPNTVVLKQNELSELMPTPSHLSLSLMQRIWGPGGTVDLACSMLGIPYEVEDDSPPLVVSAFGHLYINSLEQARRVGAGPGMLATFRLSRAAESLETEFRETFLPQLLEDVTMREAINFRSFDVERLVRLFREWSNNFITETYLQAELVNIAAEFYMQSARSELEKKNFNPAEYLGQLPETVVARAMGLLPSIRRKECTIQEFLELFGHRAPQDFELSMPRYRETLEVVDQMAQRAQDHTTHTRPSPSLSNKVLDLAVQRARRFQTLKEEAKHHCLRDFALLRPLLLELDRKLGFNGGIFTLTTDEIDRLADESFVNEAYDLIKIRQNEALKIDEPLPLEFTAAGLETIGLDLQLDPPEEGAETSLRGLRISGVGEGVGRVRVLKSADELDLFEEGEILVARFTDPTWTPLFSLAAGVVTEVGGWLSHAAILTRELGLVGIVGAPNATSQLTTGDLVRLHEDGTIEVSQRNRRKAQRFLLNQACSLVLEGGGHAVQVINISRSGLFMTCDNHTRASLALDQPVLLQLQPDSEPISGTVMRKETGVSIRFDELLSADALNNLRGTTLAHELRQTRAARDQLLDATLRVHTDGGDLSGLRSRILSSTRELLQADRISFFEYDEETDELYSLLFDIEVVGEDSALDVRFPSHKGIIGSAFTTGTSINIPDAYRDSRFNPEIDRQTGYRTRSILCCPVMLNNKPFGAMQAINKREGSFTLDDERVLHLFGEQCATALVAARNQERLSQVPKPR